MRQYERGDNYMCYAAVPLMLDRSNNENVKQRRKDDLHK